MADKIHFSELTHGKLNEMYHDCMEAIEIYSTSIGMGSICEIGSHDLYSAIEDALTKEWIMAKKLRSSRTLLEIG